MSQPKTILTLDAGGTNFVFSAIENEKETVEPVILPSMAHDLDRCLENLVKGFKTVSANLNSRPDAISFAFPGPADYPNGIIGDLPNFKAFNGGVPLGPMLEDEFGIPVFINNDGNLFAYGEALRGVLPQLNRELEEAGSTKQFQNLVGVTIGTGFGCGIVVNGVLLTGDNACGGEIHNTLNAQNPEWNAEESVSTRAVQRVYATLAGTDFDESKMPGDIYKIAKGDAEGDRYAALESFRQFGNSLGNSIANTATLIDGIVVIGGGIAGGWDLFAPEMFDTIRRNYVNFRGEESPRLSVAVYNLEDKNERSSFRKGNPVNLTVPGSGRKIEYDDSARIGIIKSGLGASSAVNIGAYAYALSKL